MKNFDQEYVVKKTNAEGREEEIRISRVERSQKPVEERTFTIGGETFVARASVAPEAFARWSMMTAGEFVLRDGQGKPILDGKGEPISTLTEEEALKVYDETVLAFLDPGQEEKWAAVRDIDAEIPLNLEDVKAVIRWLFEQQSARPTGQPSGSSSGSATAATGTPSTDASSSQAEKV